MRIDHVVLATRDLSAAADRLLEEHGLASVEGGRHPGWGTGNRIVPLGRDYVELMGIADLEEARESVLGQRVLAATEDGDAFLGWCLQAHDPEALAARLGVDVIRGGRRRPDGVELGWSLVGLTEALEDPRLPFFIRWEVEGGLHPGADAVAHRSRPSGIAWVEVGEHPTLTERVGGADLPVRTVPEGDGLIAVGIASDEGEIVLRPGS